MPLFQLADLTKDLTALKNASPGDIAKVIESYHNQVRTMEMSKNTCIQMFKQKNCFIHTGWWGRVANIL